MVWKPFRFYCKRVCAQVLLMNLVHKSVNIEHLYLTFCLMSLICFITMYYI